MKKLLALSLLIIVLQSCYYDKADQLYGVATACDTTHVTYAGTIKPIMDQHCTTVGCHDPATKSGGFDFTQYSVIVAEMQSGPQFMGAIKHESPYIPMPQNGPKLPDCDIQKFEAWKNSGYPQ